MDVAAKLLFFSIITLVCYTYAGYPVVLFILGLFKSRKRIPEIRDHPTVALVISAHNEERIIRKRIENALELDYPKNRLCIVIASDGSNDGTNNIVREYEGANVVLKSFKKREGKSSTLNRTVLGIEEEIVVFSDANAFFEKDAVTKLIRNFEYEGVGCVVGHLRYLDNHSYVGKGESLYWRYESLLNRLESRLRSVLVATGPIFAIRRNLFRPILRDVANDFQIPADIASQGYGVVFEYDAVAYERSTYFFREEFKRKRRIIIRGMTGFKHLRGRFGGALRIFQFISRKLLRWWIGPLFPLFYVSNILLLHEPFFLATFMLQNLFYLSAAVGALLRRGKVRSKIFFIPFYFVMVNGAALVAVVTYLGGSRFSVWEKAETTRAVHRQAFTTPRLQVIEGKKQVTFSKNRKQRVENLEKIT